MSEIEYIYIYNECVNIIKQINFVSGPPINKNYMTIDVRTDNRVVIFRDSECIFESEKIINVRVFLRGYFEGLANAS